MKSFLLLPATVLLFLCTSTVFAQDTEKPDKTEKTGSLKVGADYISDNVFMGRSDSAAKSVIAPTLSYTFAFGLFLTAAADYIPSRPANKLDDGNLGIGYNYSIAENVQGSLSFTKMFYASTSTQIGSSVSSESAASISYENDYLSPGVSVDFAKGKKGDRNDVFVNPTIAHDFIIVGVFGDRDYLSISPTAGLNLGTQNFYDSYLTRVNKKKHPAAYALLDKYRKGLTEFKMLDYELSAPMEYSVKPFMISFNPTLAVPENKLPKTITKGQANKATNFYFDLGLSLKF